MMLAVSRVRLNGEVRILTCICVLLEVEYDLIRSAREVAD